LGLDAVEVYNKLTDQSNLLNSYILPEYEILHTQSKEYIVSDIIEAMKEKGLTI